MSDELGIPPKVARSLAGPECRDLAKIKVQYARLDRGIFARLQPCGDGFGDRHLDLKEILERSLRVRTFIFIYQVNYLYIYFVDTCHTVRR